MIALVIDPLNRQAHMGWRLFLYLCDSIMMHSANIATMQLCLRQPHPYPSPRIPPEADQPWAERRRGRIQPLSLIKERVG